MTNTDSIMPSAGDQQFDHAAQVDQIMWGVTMIEGVPTLSEAERNMAEGCITLFYRDGDYRTKFFHGGLIIDYLRADVVEGEYIERSAEEAMMILEERAEGVILKELAPIFKESLATMREEEEEPEQAGYEVYWRGEMIAQELFDD